jgi:hypothetical protein
VVIRYQVLTEVRSAKKGSSLVDDNADQRRTSLVDKITIHKHSRVFYMPGFNPPSQDADLAAELVSLHLPSSMTSDERHRYCRAGLVDAKEELRLCAMGGALADLLR